jgi:hypothetical protein
MRSPRLLFAVAVAALGLGVAAPAAHAAQPCWKRVIVDWSKDQVINGKHYSPHCLRMAMKKAPEDLKDYSPILDDINAALLDAVAIRGGGNGGGNGPGGGGPNGSPTGTAGSGNGTNQAANAAKTISPEAKRAVTDAGTAASAPGRSHPIPLPLILLACVLGISALAAGSPPLIKRFRTRFPRLRPAPGSVRPPA